MDKPDQSGEIEVVIGEVSDMEARLHAKYNGASASPNSRQGGDERVVLTGTVRGPFCETAQTLPASFSFRSVADHAAAEAIIFDPCTWSAELPHLYQVDVEARQGENLVAEFHGQIGLNRTSHRRSYDDWK